MKDVLDLTIDDLSPEGRGLAKYNGKVVFVRDALPGEEVKAEVLEDRENMISAKSTEIIKASPDRVQGEDAKWARNGYARLANMKYDKQLAFKKEKIERLLSKAGLDDIKVEDVIASPLQKAYRNEVVFPVRKVNGQIEIGVYESRTNKFVVLNEFVLTNDEIAHTLLSVRDILRQLNISVYDPETNTGFVRDINVRRSESTNEMIVTLVTHNKDDVKLLELSGLISEKLHNINGIVINYNPHKTDKVYGKENIPVWGNDYIHDELDGLKFRISPKSAFQANGGQLETVAKKVFEAADLQKDDDLIDAYCGVGSLGLIAANKVKSVRGLDNEKVAIRDSKHNARKNSIDNATYCNGNVDQVMIRWAKNKEDADVIIASAPKKGLSKGFIDAAVKMQPRKFVYISLNPDTLVRDIKLFKEKGYTCDSIQPVDIAPQTPDELSICTLNKD